MAHQTRRNGPCGLPDGHRGSHRTEQGLANYRESKHRYEATPAGIQRRAAWNKRNPVVMALKDIHYNAKRRESA